MPVHSNTPAPSRRFLQPSSSSAAKPNTSSAGRRPAFQFARPSQSALSTSPFSRTPDARPGSGAGKDEIREESDDDAQFPSTISKKPQAREDVIQDSSQLEGDSDLRKSFNLAHRDSPTAKDDLVVQGAKYGYNWDSDDDFDSPVLKRRRTNAPTPTVGKAIHISSSPSEGPEVGEISDDEQPGSLYDRNDEIDVLPDTTHPQHTSRFRQGPSTRPDSSSITTKPSLKSLFGQHREHHQNAAETALPEAFSPSKQKGRINYEAGGAADTVRGWILQAAIDETLQNPRKEERMYINSTQQDMSGRYILSKSQDNQSWLFPVQRGSNGKSQKSENSRWDAGSEVILRGSATRWSLDLSQVGGHDRVNFAADWHLAR